MGGMLYGNPMRQAILFSIAISQIGFVTAYIIFVYSNLNSLVLAFSKCKTQLSSMTLIFTQIVLLLPLALVRNLAKLSFTALIADGFILFGLLYIWGSEIGMIAKLGVSDIRIWFNPKDYALLIGTAVFSFEGIGLIIPITDAMREPHKFPKVLSGVMIGLIREFVSFSSNIYLTLNISSFHCCWCTFLSSLWIQHSTYSHNQPPSRVARDTDRTARLFFSDPSLHSYSVIPSSSYNGDSNFWLRSER